MINPLNDVVRLVCGKLARRWAPWSSLPVLAPKPDWPPMRPLELRVLAVHMHAATSGSTLSG